MERKKMIISIISATAIAAVAVLVIGSYRRSMLLEVPGMKAVDRPYVEDYVKTDKYTELIGMFDTEDAAGEAAALYNIELASYEYGLAVFHVPNDRDIKKLLEEGKKNKWPLLEYNYIRHLD